MKRRGFLAMFGAAVTTPFLPGAAAAASGGSLKIAIAHAQKFPVISVAGLSKRGGVSPAQAEALIRELAQKGMVRIVGPSRSGTVRAASKIMINDPWGIARTAQDRAGAQPPDTARPADQRRKPAQTAQAQIAPWLAHLHDLCRARGMALNPRCFA